MAGISDHATRFAVCESCCKLYNPKDISTKKAGQTPKILRCTHVEFPNHVNISRRVSCDTILSKKVRVQDGIIRKPVSIYPVVNLKQQFLKLFQQSGFEEACRRWAYRPSKPQLSDIYDGRIWKSFSDDEGELFFRPETADSHIGLMLNLDWFQPFETSQYSVGVIYAVICNLQRQERFFYFFLFFFYFFLHSLIKYDINLIYIKGLNHPI
jgi:hypothetical protein